MVGVSLLTCDFRDGARPLQACPVQYVLGELWEDSPCGLLSKGSAGSALLLDFQQAASAHKPFPLRLG